MTRVDWSPIWISLATSAHGNSVHARCRAGRGSVAGAPHAGPVMALVDGIFLLPLVLPPTVVGFFLSVAFRAQRPPRQDPASFRRDDRFLLAGDRDRGRRRGVPLDVPHGARRARAGGSAILCRRRERSALPNGASFARSRCLWRGPACLRARSSPSRGRSGEFGATLMLAGNIPGQDGHDTHRDLFRGGSRTISARRWPGA